MEWAALFALVQSWGPSAISSLLVFVVLHLIKKIDTNSKKESERATELRKYINDTLNNFGSRLSIVEREYTRNDTFLRELSGWKSEINRVSDQITNLFIGFTQAILPTLDRSAKKKDASDVEE